MIMGHNPLNVNKSLGAIQSTKFYIPNVLIPLTESKVALEAGYGAAIKLWDVNGLKIRPAGRPELEYYGFDVQDESSNAKMDKGTGTSSDFFCSYCTCTRPTWRAGRTSHLHCAETPYENQLCDDNTLVIWIDDTGTVGCDRRVCRYPIIPRVHESPTCKVYRAAPAATACSQSAVLPLPALRVLPLLPLPALTYTRSGGVPLKCGCSITIGSTPVRASQNSGI
jgi:hypothetical protein